LTAARHRECVVISDWRIEAVELGDIFDGNMAASLVNDDIPSPRGERREKKNSGKDPSEGSHDS